MFDWVGPDWTLGTFKQTISTSCLKSISGGAIEKKKKKKKSSRGWTPGHLCKIPSRGPFTLILEWKNEAEDPL